VTGRAQQRGAALLALMLVLVLGASWILIDRMNRVSGEYAATERAHNARVLQRAKQALIGHAVMQAGKEFEDDPGRLVCPEAAGNIGGNSEGQSASTCAGHAVGRLPWRTLAIEKLLDASGEPLWYVVSSGWHLLGAGAGTTVINSDSVGQLNVDSVANDAVALIIAPGRAMNVVASAGCTARNQARITPDPSINPLDYVECYNAATGTFVTTGPTASFNDQVVKITAAELLPGIEAAIAPRIERKIVPELKTVYAAPSWGLAGSNVLYPFAATFATPSTSSMQGTVGNTTGLLPFNYSETSPGSGVACTPGAGVPRCSPSFVAWSGATLSAPSIYSPTCTPSATQIDCTYYYWCLLICPPTTTFNFTLTATAANVGMAMRTFNSTVSMTNINSAGRSVSGAMNADGSATVTLTGTMTADGSGGFLLPLLAQLTCLMTLLDLITNGCMPATISVPITLLADHRLLDTADLSTTTARDLGWFVRNKWHEVTYYAVATGYSPSTMPIQPSCTTGTTCLSVTNISPAGAQRAILILAGRSITGSRATLGDYLEFGNATAAFESQTPSLAMDAASKKPFNDRVVVLDSN